MRNKVEITIAGRKLKVGCPQGQESALLSAADELNSRLAQIAKSDAITTPEQTMMMAALNLANDLLQTYKAQEQERQATQSKIELLQSTIEHALLQQNKTA